MNNIWSRRNFLRYSAAGVGGATLASGLSGQALAQAVKAAEQAADPKFLIVMCCSGGASLVDSFMAVRESEGGASAAKPPPRPGRDLPPRKAPPVPYM